MTDSYYKILIIGDGGVGKSTYVRQINTGTFKSTYDTTIGLEPHPITLLTSAGEKNLTILDTAGQEKFGSLRQELYKNTHAAFIMFDLTSRSTYVNVSKWYRDITDAMGTDFPIVIIGNKLDLERKVKSKLITFPKRKGIPYIEISVKDSIDLDKPFNYILKKLFDDESICCLCE